MVRFVYIIWAASWQNQQCACAPSEDSDQPGHQSLRCPHEKKLESLSTHWARSEDSDQTRRMPRLIWVFAGRTLTLLVLSRGCSFKECARGILGKCTATVLTSKKGYRKILSNDCRHSMHLVIGFSSPEPKAHTRAYSIGRHPSLVRRQHFQTTSPLNLFRFLPYFTYNIYMHGGSNSCVFVPIGQKLWLIWQLIVAIDLQWEKLKLAFIVISLQIFWQNFTEIFLE